MVMNMKTLVTLCDFFGARGGYENYDDDDDDNV